MLEQTQPAEPEKPISSSDEDSLGRGEFVNRISRALINPRSGKASGVVLGITGEWGSGKTSLLNLLEKKLKSDVDNSIVVRFDPWLVSHHEDLIKSFFEDLFASIPRSFSALRKSIKKYSRYVAPIAQVGDKLVRAYAPVPAPIVEAGSDAINSIFSRTASLHEMRKQIQKQVESISVPIIVLIDELDRVDDCEVRMVAKLVRSVADFPNISYVLAYDKNRVTQALGGGDAARGQAYLEKVVQLQIPMPHASDDDLNRLIVSKISRLVDEINLPHQWSKDERFAVLQSIIVSRHIKTPRDVSRLVNTYHVIGAITQNEVDWVDAIAYCVILVKYPDLVNQIWKYRWFLVEGIFGYSEPAFFSMSHEERVKAVLGDVYSSNKLKSLCGFLFPALEKRVSSEDRPDSLCFRRPFITIMRLCHNTGETTKKDVDVFFSLDKEGMVKHLRQLCHESRLLIFLERLRDAYNNMLEKDKLLMWAVLMEFIKRDPSESIVKNVQMISDVPGLLSAMFLRGMDHESHLGSARKIYQEVILTNGDGSLASYILRFSQRSQTYNRFYESVDGETISKKLALKLKSSFLDNDDFLSGQWNMQCIFMIISNGIWDSACCERMKTLLENDKNLQDFVFINFGAGRICSAESINKLVGSVGWLRDAVSRPLKYENQIDIDPEIISAFKRVVEGSFPDT